MTWQEDDSKFFECCDHCIHLDGVRAHYDPCDSCLCESYERWAGNVRDYINCTTANPERVGNGCQINRSNG